MTLTRSLLFALRPSLRSVPPALARFGLVGWGVAIGAALASAVVMGIPVVMINNPWFVRMTPVRPQDWVVWLASSALIGLIAASYVVDRRGDESTTALTGGFFSYLAIGCPICNKIVVALLGVSGALTFFGPAQIVIGAASVALLGWTLLLRARALAEPGCALPAPAA